MKTKMMILLLAGFSFSIFATAQLNQFTPGIKGGLSSARLSGFTGDNRISAHVGFFLHHTINNHWCFQPELLYSGEGQRYIASSGEERTLALDYVQLPLMFQYFPIKQLYFEFGPQFGLLVSAQDNGANEKINSKSDFTNGQVGLNLGVGVNITPQFGFYGRYSFGATDVSKFDNIVDHSLVGQLGVAIRLK